MSAVGSVQIENFKSVKRFTTVDLGSINVLIGANGAGKSNFINFFRFLNKLANKELQFYVAQNGRADNFLFMSSKISDFLYGRIDFNAEEPDNFYAFMMKPDQGGNLLFSMENKGGDTLNFGNYESALGLERYRDDNIIKMLASLKIFHFQDTSFNAAMRSYCNTVDYAYLHEDGGNIAAFLYMIQKSHPHRFKMIEYVVKSIAPFFDRFYLEPDEINPNQIFLRWQEKGYDQLFSAHNFSDGTIRMICLAALLIQPNPPETIIIDEPELGLHPLAIVKLTAMIKSASVKSQIIIATQSVTFVDQFQPEDIIVVERKDTQTIFKRQSSEELKIWLEDYSIGEIWQKNVMGGRP